MKRVTLILVLMLLAGSVFAQAFPTKLISITNNIDDVIGRQNSFREKLIGQNDYDFSFYFTNANGWVDLSGFNVAGRIAAGGVNFVDLRATNIAISSSNVTFRLPRTNIPPDATYILEIYAWSGSTTNPARTLSQGELKVSHSLFADTNAFPFPVFTNLIDYMDRTELLSTFIVDTNFHATAPVSITTNGDILTWAHDDLTALTNVVDTALVVLQSFEGDGIGHVTNLTTTNLSGVFAASSLEGDVLFISNNYVRIDGALAMTGDLNAGGSGVTNAADVRAGQFHGGGSLLTNLTAGNIAAGGTLLALDANALTNLPASASAETSTWASVLSRGNNSGGNIGLGGNIITNVGDLRGRIGQGMIMYAVDTDGTLGSTVQLGVDTNIVTFGRSFASVDTILRAVEDPEQHNDAVPLQYLTNQGFLTSVPLSFNEVGSISTTNNLIVTGTLYVASENFALAESGGDAVISASEQDLKLEAVGVNPQGIILSYAVGADGTNHVVVSNFLCNLVNGTGLAFDGGQPVTGVVTLASNAAADVIVNGAQLESRLATRLGEVGGGSGTNLFTAWNARSFTDGVPLVYRAAGGGGITNDHPLMASFRCIKDEDQLNVADATDVTVIFTSTVFDTHNTFNTNTFSYDIPVDGLYQFNAGINWYPIDATRIARLKVEQYGDGFTNVVLQKLARSNTADDSIVLNGSFMLTCTTTQSVRVVAQHSNGDGTPDIRLFEALWGTYFDGHMVGKAQ